MSPFAAGPPIGEPPSFPPGPAPAEGDDAAGGAAAKARDLIAELSGGQPARTAPSIPEQPPGGGPVPGAPLPPLSPAPPDSPARPYLPAGPPVPSFGPGGAADVPGPIPSYAPTEPPGLGFPADAAADVPPLEDEPASVGQWSDGSGPPPPGRARRSRGAGDDVGSDDGHREAGSRRLPVLLLLLGVLLGAGYLVKTQVLDSSSSDNATITPRVRASATPAATRTLGPAELAASLKDPHFKHGYDWGKKHGAVPAAEREQVCRTEALKQRAAGYPWGAHDRAGCLIGLAG